MNQEDILQLLARCNAVQNGHFKLSAGDHASVYVNKDALFQHPIIFGLVADEIAKRIKDGNFLCDVVVGMPKGGIAMIDYVAPRLSTPDKEVLAVYAEHDRGDSAFRRGSAEHIFGKNIILLEDVITSGKTTSLLIEATKRAHGKITGIFCLWNRSGNEYLFRPYHLESLISIQIDSYPPSKCPQCKEGKPISEELGHGV